MMETMTYNKFIENAVALMDEGMSDVDIVLMLADACAEGLISEYEVSQYAKYLGLRIDTDDIEERKMIEEDARNTKLAKIDIELFGKNAEVMEKDNEICGCIGKVRSNPNYKTTNTVVYEDWDEEFEDYDDF